MDCDGKEYNDWRHSTTLSKLQYWYKTWWDKGRKNDCKSLSGLTSQQVHHIKGSEITLPQQCIRCFYLLSTAEASSCKANANEDDLRTKCYQLTLSHQRYGVKEDSMDSMLHSLMCCTSWLKIRFLICNHQGLAETLVFRVGIKVKIWPENLSLKKSFPQKRLFI